MLLLRHDTFLEQEEIAVDRRRVGIATRNLDFRQAFGLQVN